jgi:hypothetical protein
MARCIAVYVLGGVWRAVVALEWWGEWYLEAVRGVGGVGGGARIYILILLMGGHNEILSHLYFGGPTPLPNQTSNNNENW